METYKCDRCGITTRVNVCGILPDGWERRGRYLVCGGCRVDFRESGTSQPDKKCLDVETDDFGCQQFASPDKHCKFWLCWVEGKSAPVKKHLTICAAEDEANRLSMLLGNEEASVYILEAKSYYVTSRPKKSITRYVEL